MVSPPEPFCSISLNQFVNLTGGFLRRVQQRSDDKSMCPYLFFCQPWRQRGQTVLMTLIRFVPAYRITQSQTELVDREL